MISGRKNLTTFHINLLLAFSACLPAGRFRTSQLLAQIVLINHLQCLHTIWMDRTTLKSEAKCLDYDSYDYLMDFDFVYC